MGVWEYERVGMGLKILLPSANYQLPTVNGQRKQK
jgi:hypothetical protein